MRPWRLDLSLQKRTFLGCEELDDLSSSATKERSCGLFSRDFIADARGVVLEAEVAAMTRLSRSSGSLY